MILMYLLFALTVSTVLTAAISARIPQNREGEAFIGFFVSLMVLAWAMDEWLLPALSAGQRTSWPPILLLIVFGGVFAASTILSARGMSGPPQRAMVNHNNRHDAEAIAFDIVLWFALLIMGIVVLRSVV